MAPDAPGRLAQMANAHQWWPIQTFSMAERAAGASSAAPGIDEFLDAELVSAGLADDRLLLVGFSQGTMMALHVGLRRPRPLAGVIGFSGMLVSPERLASEVRSRPPVLLVHGTADDVVPFGLLAAAEGALRSASVPVETHVSPGVGHTVGPDGLSAAARFAARVFA